MSVGTGAVWEAEGLGDGLGPHDLPAKCRPSVVPHGLRADTCASVSPLTRGGGGAGQIRKGAGVPALPPFHGGLSGARTMDRWVLHRSGIHGEDMKRRSSTMILSWVRPRGSPCRPSRWGPAGTMGLASRCALRGAASPPPPPVCVCVCVSVCLKCVSVCGGGGGSPFFTRSPGGACMATLASSGRVAPHYSRPTVQARGASLDQCDMHLGHNLARCPRTTLEVGW